VDKDTDGSARKLLTQHVRHQKKVVIVDPDCENMRKQKKAMTLLAFHSNSQDRQINRRTNDETNRETNKQTNKHKMSFI